MSLPKNLLFFLFICYLVLLTSMKRWKKECLICNFFSTSIECKLLFRKAFQLLFSVIASPFCKLQAKTSKYKSKSERELRRLISDCLNEGIRWLNWNSTFTNKLTSQLESYNIGAIGAKDSTNDNFQDSARSFDNR